MVLAIYKRYNANEIYKYREKVRPFSYYDQQSWNSIFKHLAANETYLADGQAHTNISLNTNTGVYTLSNYKTVAVGETAYVAPRDINLTEPAGLEVPKGIIYSSSRTSSGNEILAFIATKTGLSSSRFLSLKQGYIAERYLSGYEQGSYVDEITAEDGSYPNYGRVDNYFYERIGLANRAPTISGSTTNIGTVKTDFSINYTVSDPDGDDVKVQVMVDNSVIQYPISVPLNNPQTVNFRLADYSLGNHTITITATDSSNASATRTYYFTKSNVAPTISGSDMDLGGKYQDFTIEYIVQDADADAVKVEIKVDDVVKQPATNTTLGVKKYYTLPIKDYGLGRHTVVITATDTAGASTQRVYTFQKVNSAPVISGNDISLGAKNTGFSYVYQVSDNENDPVTITEKINGNIIRTLYNATLNTDLTITISTEQIKDFELNKLNTIEVVATDGAATTYRRVTFVRNNMPPIISGSDTDLGSLDKALNYSFSATDPEGDKIFATILLDNKVYKARHAITDGAGQSIKIEGLDFIKITEGKHILKIVVEDDKGFSSTRTVTFTRVIERLVMKLAKNGIETDELATRILVSTVGIYVAKGASLKIEVTNNSFDESPVWEDATTMVLAGKAFNFQNKEKEDDKAGIDIKVTIDKGTSTMPSYISTIGGSFD